MLKDVTLGRYYSSDSVLHRLDPRTKMAAIAIYLVSVFAAKGIWLVCATAAVLVVLLVISKVPFSYMVRGLRAVVMILVVTNAVNIWISPDGWVKATINTLRMVELVLASNLLTLTTRPKDIADGFEKANGWATHLGLPVHDMATVLSTSVRFLPILTNEATRIIDAQKSRCADFESGNIIKRARTLMPILVPLFNSAFRRADQLAEAMDCRLYGTVKPSRLHPLKYRASDIICYILMAVWCGLFIAVRLLCS